jgi:flagellar protein FliO/FliZ
MSLSSVLLSLFALAAVLGLVVLTGRVVRARGWNGLPGNPRGPSRLSPIQTLALDPRRRLHLVRCDGRHVVLLTGGATDVVVGWLDGQP